MSKIPQTFIDDLLNRTDIIDIIDARVPLKKTGANYKACCPFHNEKNPSFTVSQSKQFYHCFGCSANGNVISFLMEYDQMTFPEAIETLAQLHGLPMPERGPRQKPANDNSKQLYAILQQASQFYQNQLRQHPQKQVVIDYLKQRGLSGQIAKQFAIGFAPAGWDNLHKALADAAPKQLIEAGLLLEKTPGKPYDRFRDRVMFPIRDRRGRTIGFGGRVLRSDDEPKYLNSPETPVFHKGSELYGLYDALRANRTLSRLLLVEGYMDVVALAQHGINYAVATLGTATTADHFHHVLRHCKHIVCCFDGDNAGRKAAWKALQTALPLLQDDVNVQFMFLPDGEDPDSLVRQLGQQAFEQQIHQAQALSQFLFEHLEASIDMRNLDGYTQLVHHAAPLLKQIPGEIYRYQLLNALADRANIPLTDVAQLTDIPLRNQTFNKPTSNVSNKPASLMQQAISILVQHPSVAAQVETLAPWRQSSLPGSKLLVTLLERIQADSNLSTGRLLEHWRDTPEAKLLNNLASKELILQADQLPVEFAATLAKLQQQQQELQLLALQRQAKQQTLTPEQRKRYQQLLAERQ